MTLENDLPTFRPFTREELAEIEKRIFEKNLQKKKKAEKNAKNVAVSFKLKLAIAFCQILNNYSSQLKMAYSPTLLWDMGYSLSHSHDS